MATEALFKIFARGSRTYFYSSLFFPKKVREDIARLYAFVRTADNFVDTLPQDPQGLTAFRRAYRQELDGIESGDLVAQEFVLLMKRKGFEARWVEAFFRSMELDLQKKSYETLEETVEYMYGSAEVIGLMISRLLDLPPAATEAARALGRAMQYINFIRDLQEDLLLGRTYLPRKELVRHGLQSLRREETEKKPEQFRDFIREQLALYRTWQSGAEEGYRYLPRRYLVPIKTAAQMYAWTARQIEQDPFIVYRRQVKPGKLTIFSKGLLNLVLPSGGKK